MRKHCRNRVWEIKYATIKRGENSSLFRFDEVANLWYNIYREKKGGKV